jgi:hypothetical protein
MRKKTKNAARRRRNNKQQSPKEMLDGDVNAASRAWDSPQKAH